MTDEVKTPEGSEGTEQVQEKQFSAVEQKAIEQGWIPKEEFQGDESEFIDAGEFVRRGELFGKIEHQSKELKQLRSAFEALKNHNSKVYQAGYDKALKSVKEAKRQALADGEHEKFFELERQEEEIKEEKEEFEQNQPQVPQGPHPEFVAWTEKNSWYNKDRAMRVFADDYGIELRRQGYSPAEVLKKVESEVKKEFAHKFKNPKAERPSGVEAPTRSGTSSKDDFVMSDMEKEIMRKFVKQGVMTEKEYKDQLKLTRDK